MIDIRMPGMDGYELATRLRDELDTCPVLVAVSGLTGDEHATKATAAGFGWLFRKPIDPADLLAALEASALGAGV